ncbi:MAG: DHH family phosphoesterase [Candidatus Humimicrobiaceae bacterium]
MAPGDNNFEKIANILKNNDYFVIFTHSYPDGDAIGSSIALYKLLLNIGKKADIVCDSEMPYQYDFLPYVSKIIKDLSDLSFKHEYVALFLDCADIKRININEKDLRKNAKHIINIDHHFSNTAFGDINSIDPSKSATAEIIFLFFENYFKKYLDKEIAESLYTGILTDTGKFQYSNTTKEVHRIIGKLLEYDINPSLIYSSIYENEPASRFKLLALVLKRVKIINKDSLVYSYILRRDFKKFDLPYSSNDGIIELLRAANDIKVAALFKETGSNAFKVSLRSSGSSVNVAEIANFFGGGGHKMAAAFSACGRLDNIVNELVGIIGDD